MPKKLHSKKFIRATGGEAVSATRVREDRDDAVRLLREIQEHRLDSRDLSKVQRQACLLVLANGKQTSPELAALFCVSPQLIRKDLGEIRRKIGQEVTEWSMAEVLGQLTLAREKCVTLAYRSEDPGLAWSIERDYVKLLKELGVVGSSAQEAGARITIEALGQGYERATGLLAQALDPILTGRVVESQVKDPRGVAGLGLPLPKTLSPGDQDP